MRTRQDVASWYPDQALLADCRLCLLAVVAVTEAIKYDRMNNGIFFAVMAGCSAIFIRKYLKLHKKHELYISIMYVIAATAFLVAWILQLTK